MKVEISIIIPYRRYIKYLRECLNSLEKQTIRGFEIIIAYHETAHRDIEEVKKEFINFEQIRYIDCGLSNTSSARNKGIDVAKGEFLCFLDADDYLLPDALEHWLSYIQTSTMNIDVLLGTIHETSLKYENFLIDYYEHQTNFIITNFLNVNIKDKSNLKNVKFNAKTVLGKLLRRDFILERGHRFDESLESYSELPFMLQTMEYLPQVEGAKEVAYIKRKHDDLIIAPSLTQALGNKKAVAISEAFLVTNKLLNPNSNITKSLDYHICEYIWNEVIEQLVFEKSHAIQIEIVKALHEMALHVVDENVSNLPMKKRKLLKLLKSNNFSQIMRYSKFIVHVAQLKASTKNKLEFKKYLYTHWLVKLKPRKRTLIFESFLGRQYSCNPKAIYEYIQQHHPEYKLYWSVDSKYAGNFKNLNQIKRFSFNWFLKMARAEYWVFNSRTPVWLSKPKETKYLQTWHGTPLKRLVFDVEDVYMPGTTTEKYKQNFYTESRNWDYLISPNSYSTEIFKSAFRFDKQILEIGYPRNDVLYTGNTSVNINRIKEKLGLPMDKKLILYAPTFRDNQFYKSGNYKFDLPLDLSDLQKRYGENCVLLLRMHYLVAENFDLNRYEGFAYDFSNKADINDLYLVSDLLITDYSSVFFDYANLQRPIIFYAYDLENYRETLRGFYFDLTKVAPGPLVTDYQALIDTLNEFMTQGEFETYRDVYDSFYETYCNFDDGNVAQRVVENVILK